MEQSFSRDKSRRSFLAAAPMVAAAAVALADVDASGATVQVVPAAAAGSFQLFTAQTLAQQREALQVSPGNSNLVSGADFTIALTVEKAKSAKEFEWHEGRDHVLQILDGATVVEVGGTPKGGRNTRPGEWLAPDSAGAAAVALNKGDMLVIPRGTPHRRSTAGSVTLLLISPMGEAKN